MNTLNVNVIINTIDTSVSTTTISVGSCGGSIRGWSIQTNLSSGENEI